MLAIWLSNAGDPRAAEPTRPPNIVFILADDLGWTDLGCQGSGFYETPNIDRLARDGVRFTNAYTCGPNCSPTRASIMAGQYGPRTGFYTNTTGNRGIDAMRKLVAPPTNPNLGLEIVTLPDCLKKAGYATGMFGKWHLGDGAEYHPSRRGFDEAIVTSQGMHYGFGTDPAVDVPEGTYLTDFITDRAVDFIDRHQAEPFFLYLAEFVVHLPLEAKQEMVAKYEKKPRVGGHFQPTYAAMVESLDGSVGRVVDKLDSLGLGDDTLIVFTSDNGGVTGYSNASVNGTPEVTDNAPLRGSKGTLYEGGVRVPLIARWNGVVPAGGVCHQPVISCDYYPTLLEIAAAGRHDGQTLDGLSFAACLKSAEATLPRDRLFWHFPGYLETTDGGWRTTPCAAVRVGNEKLVEFFEDGRLELYNLADDIGEERDLASSMPERAKELHAIMLAWRQEMNAPMPRPKTHEELANPKPTAPRRRRGKAGAAD